MLFRKTTVEQLNTALHATNLEYQGNIKIVDVNLQGKSNVRARLSVVDSHAYGARTSWSGRHGPYASWEAHRDFLRALFRINADAVVVTSMAKYTAPNFEDTFPPTGQKNIGSMMQPCTMPDCSVGKPFTVKFGTLTPQGLYTHVRTLERSTIRACPHVILVPDHYRADGSCYCNDPSKVIMKEWGYRFDQQKAQWV